MKNYYRLLVKFLIAVLLLSGICFTACVQSAIADDHGHKSKHSNTGHAFSNSKHGKGDDGNEFTGQATAWIFAAANVPVFLGLLIRGLTRHASLRGNTKDLLKQFNRAQKKYLMRFHFILNPLAVFLALIHFILSHCRSSVLPEWGLALMAIIAAIGVIIKFKIAPKPLQQTVYQVHTNPLPFGLLVAILLIGHSIVD